MTHADELLCWPHARLGHQLAGRGMPSHDGATEGDVPQSSISCLSVPSCTL
jgi:hypothetical protein